MGAGVGAPFQDHSCGRPQRGPTPAPTFSTSTHLLISSALHPAVPRPGPRRPGPHPCPFPWPSWGPALPILGGLHGGLFALNPALGDGWALQVFGILSRGSRALGLLWPPPPGTFPFPSPPLFHFFWLYHRRKQVQEPRARYLEMEVPCPVWGREHFGSPSPQGRLLRITKPGQLGSPGLGLCV